MMEVVFRKELWSLRSQLFSYIAPPLLLVLLLAAVVFTNGVVLTPQTKKIAIDQIMSSPAVFWPYKGGG